MIIIDASSHFTKSIVPTEPPALDERPTNLVKSARLSFGHWKIGDQHDTFVVLLRAMRDFEVADIFDDLKKTCAKHFGNKKPDVLIYPADSTAIHLAGRFADELECKTGLIVASPAFRGHGMYELRLETPQSNIEVLRKASRLNVLFFDDSLSSGSTERNVIKAFNRDIGIYRTASTTRWLTYTVLRRGRRALQEAPLPQKGYLKKSFTTIGPESLTPSACPMCRASKKLKDASVWAQAARRSVWKLIERLDNIAEPRPIERLISPLACLSSEISHELLRLEHLEMPEACVCIWKRHLAENPTNVSLMQQLAAVMYLAIHFDEIGSYIASNDLIRMIENTGKAINLLQQPHIDAFLLALAVFPASVIGAAAIPLITHFTKSQAVDITAAVLTLAFSSQHCALMETSSYNTLSQRREILINRRRELVERVKCLLQNPTPTPRFGVADVTELILADLTTISHPPREDKPAWVVRTLSALLHRGEHPSFLSEQVNCMTSETSGAVRNSLLQALELIDRLPPSVTSHLEKNIQTVKAALCACDPDDWITIKALADAVVGDLWEESIHKKLVLYPKVLESNVSECTTAPVEKFRGSLVRTEHIFILPSDNDTLDCKAVGPGKTSLKSHISNLLTNPFEHFPVNQLDEAHLLTPLVIVYLKQDRDQENLLLLVADRSNPPKKHNLWTLLAGGLANVRASMQLFGGDVDYEEAAGGFLKSPLFAPTETQQEFLSTFNLDPKAYRNIFVTSFPITLQTL